MSNDTPRGETTTPNAEAVSWVAVSRFSERFAPQNHTREATTSARRPSIGRPVRVPRPRRPKIGCAIREHFADGKWHAVETIATKIEADQDHVATTLDGICKNQTYSCRAEKKKVGTHVEYRIFKLNKTISSHELIEKLAPIVEGLKEQGRKNMVTMSPQTVAVLAHRLQKLLDEWAE
jgi:hypothetical protein